MIIDYLNLDDLDNTRLESRKAAARWLGQSGDPRALGELVGLIDHEKFLAPPPWDDRDLRLTIVKVLEQIEDPRVDTALLNLLGSSGFSVGKRMR